MFTSSPFTDQNLRELKDAVQTDNRGCLTIGQEAKAKKYRVVISDMDQILLAPVTSIPERELWWHNLAARGSVERGLQ